MHSRKEKDKTQFSNRYTGRGEYYIKGRKKKIKITVTVSKELTGIDIAKYLLSIGRGGDQCKGDGN